MEEQAVKVSVHMITYNHENYIAQAIEGVLMQKTDFPIELIVSDDCSTDSTREIIEQYAKVNLEILKPLYREINMGSMANFLDTFSHCTGKYIAVCEGDDYWTDPLKLQKQVDFLERNPTCSIHFHAAKHFNEKEPGKSYIHRPKKIPKDSKFHIKDAIFGGGDFMTTNSMLFRAEFIKELPDWFHRSPVGDIPLMLILASKGEIGYLDDNMSVYRLMASGSWTADLNSSKQKVENHYKAILRMLDDFNEWTKYKYSTYVFLMKSENLIVQKYYIYSTKYRLVLSNLSKLYYRRLLPFFGYRH